MHAENYWEPHQILFDIPTISTDSHKSFSQTSSPPSHVNATPNETNPQGEMSPRSEENLSSSDDVWLIVSDIPLFTQPTSAPPPSRPPPPRPTQVSRAALVLSASNQSIFISMALVFFFCSGLPRKTSPVLLKIVTKFERHLGEYL